MTRLTERRNSRAGTLIHGDRRMNARSLMVRARYRLRTAISHIPSIYLRLADLRRRDNDGAKIVTAATDLVVEAFPRSGNTFTVTALQNSQPQRLNIAHHLHAPAKLIEAVRLRKPALLIIRRPKDAVLSFVLRHPSIPVAQGLKSWLHFHNALLPYTAGMLVVTFDQVTSDLGAVVDRINARFGMSLSRLEHTPLYVDTLFRKIEMRSRELLGREDIDEREVSRPSSERTVLKASLEKHWQTMELRLHAEVAECLYEKLALLSTNPS